MAAITELCEQLDVGGALDAAVGSIKQRARGHSAGQLLVGLVAAQLAGEGHRHCCFVRGGKSLDSFGGLFD
jgi:hypothetical protein